MTISIFVLMGVATPFFFLDAQERERTDTPRGSIAGTVHDAETLVPLAGANVAVIGSQRGATSDAEGRFMIADLPVGAHVLRVSYIGYQPLGMPDVIVRSSRTTMLQVALQSVSLNALEVVVDAPYFTRADDFAVSSMALSAEEIRREAGTGGDISRIIAAFPSIAKGNDTRNDLIVRGGSPIENAFFVDGIEVPNINHYPQFGASGGAIGIINIDAIRDVEFSAGGFAPRYGDRLSSVMNIALREGSRDEIEMQADLHFMGLGAQAEGPLPGLDASWFVSARRSWLDFLLSAFSDENPSSTPVYGDVHAKVVWRPAEGHTLSILDIFADDASSNDRTAAIEAGENSFGQLDSRQNTAGLAWTWVWGTTGFSNTTLSHSSTIYDQWYASVAQGDTLFRNGSSEARTTFRTMQTLRLGEEHTLESGFDLSHAQADFHVMYGNSVSGSSPVPAFVPLSSWSRIGVHIQHTWKPRDELSIAWGVRADYAELVNETTLSPRLSIRWDLSSTATLSLAGGVYTQTLPAVLLAQNASNADLPSPRALQGVFGYSQLLDAATRTLVEIFVKEYDRMPVTAVMPARFVLDDLALNNDYFAAHGPFAAEGRARAYGIECSVQKRLVDGLYGTLSASWARSFGRAADGVWRPRAHDTRYSIALLGGWRLSRDWEISTRWILSGGAPFTPYDEPASRAAGFGVPDPNRIAADRLPAYHSLNLRVDRRFFFEHSTLTAFLAVWNVYGRENIPFYRWNESTNRQEAPTLWSNSPLPVFGLEFEF